MYGGAVGAGEGLVEGGILGDEPHDGFVIREVNLLIDDAFVRGEIESGSLSSE